MSKLYFYPPSAQVKDPALARKPRLYGSDGREFPDVTSVAMQPSDVRPDLVKVTVEMYVRRDELQVVASPPALPELPVFLATIGAETGERLLATVAAESEEAALAELALDATETLESIELVGTARGERFTRTTILSREQL